MAYPNHPNCPSYSFTNSYKVRDGYRILHLPQLNYPTQKTYAPNTFYLNTPTCGGSLILGGSTHFVTQPSAVQTVGNGDTILVNSAFVKVKSAGGDIINLKLAKGTYDGQHVYIQFEGSGSGTFHSDETTSRIKGGGGSQGVDGSLTHGIWNATDGLWWQVKGS